MCGYCAGSSVTWGHLHTQPHRRWLILAYLSFKNCWVWCQLRPTWCLLACCTWDLYSGGSRPKGSPRGKNPLCMIKGKRRCLCALDMWKKPWFLSQGLVLGAPCCRVMLATDASLTGWGVVMSGHPARSLWSGRHLTWHINCLEMLAMYRALKHFLPNLRDRHALVRTNNTSVVFYVYPQGVCVCATCISWCTRSLCGSKENSSRWEQFIFLDIWIWEQTPCRGKGWSPRNECFTPSWGSRYGEFWARLGWICLRLVRHRTVPSGSLWLIQLCWGWMLCYRLCRGFVCTPFPDRSAQRSSRESAPGWGPSIVINPYWPGRVWFSDLISLLDGSGWRIPVRRDLLSQVEGMIFHPCSELWKLWMWPTPTVSTLKVIVHPKMKILSSFTHLHVIPNLYDFLFNVEHKIRYFEEFWRTKQSLVPINFQSKEINTKEVNGDRQLFDCQHSSKYLILCDMRVSKLYIYICICICNQLSSVLL